ncbi:MAG: PTS alpha-glucoside transporter subunit IIBC [Candidatus Ratteibacteria bacterium]|nr:PTS alpha-glucoside transporter subunit IIBC [Candidatus Ratteibacteria bacterium]
MDIIIVCHTEFGFVHNRRIIFDKSAKEGVTKGVLTLVNIADKYSAKLTFALMPEAADYFPKRINSEIGLHIHPGWEEFQVDGIKYYAGDAYLRKHCSQSSTSTFLTDYSYEEQLNMIDMGKKYLESKLGVQIKSFVAGRWAINNYTVQALVKVGITHDFSATPYTKLFNSNWAKLPRICLPYNPDKEDYQQRGELPLLIVPVSQTLFWGNVSPEIIPMVGFPWLKASFLEYYRRGVPLFHICLHSSAMTDPYFISAMDNFLYFISSHKNINFKFGSEIGEYKTASFKTYILPYIFNINKDIMKTFFRIVRNKLK